MRRQLGNNETLARPCRLKNVFDTFSDKTIRGRQRCLAQNPPDFFFHRYAVFGRPPAQSRKRFLINLPDRDTCHLVFIAYAGIAVNIDDMLARG